MAESDGAQSTLRFYVLSDVAGALEPCGCTKNQLGGIDHFASFLQQQKSTRAATALLTAGPLFFMDPVPDPLHATQDAWKAEALASSFSECGLTAFTPGVNDWANASTTLVSLAERTKGQLALANVDLKPSDPPRPKTSLVKMAGVQVGIVGILAPRERELTKTFSEGAAVRPAADALGDALTDLKKRGAQLLVALAALPRGEALRIAETHPELHLLVLGQASDAGDANSEGPPPVMIQQTLVVQTANHLQKAGVVEFVVRGGDFHFRDGSGITQSEKVTSLGRRIAELEQRLGEWTASGGVSESDLAQRRSDLEKLKSERQQLAQPSASTQGSVVRYEVVAVGDGLGRDPQVHARMAEYYKKVNDHNKVAFQGRQPEPVAKGKSGYVGIEVCSSCHEQERKVWDRTQHARAYRTLASQSKEYNLDCVGCHVTGYEKPGGSTVTHNAGLRDVQCEQCHGPGSEHVKKPEKGGLILASPSLDSCVSSCHHPPHVEAFDPALARARIVGPGHGMPDDAPWPSWADEHRN